MARATKGSKLDLHDALSRYVYHNALLCTYTFDPLFFEDYCLDRFSALSSNNNISVCTDRGTYNKIALAAESRRPKHLNLRYLLSPIDTNGRFHPKLFLFSTKTSGRLIIGSANFTRSGLTSNAEVADVFDFELDESEEFLQLFQDAFGFVSALSEQWQVESLVSNVGEFRRTTPWLAKESSPDDKSIRLLHNLEKSLWQQIASLVPPSIDRIHVVSRFFDDSPTLIDRLIRDFSPKDLFFYTQNGLTTMTADWLAHPCVRSGQAEIFLCTYEDDGHPQPLHAKAIVFESSQTTTVVYGSANFTTPALLRHGKAGNIETVIALSGLPPKALNARKFCDPTSSAFHLRAPEDLKSALRDEDEHLPAMPARLIEVVLADETLMIHAILPSELHIETVAARVHFQGSRGRSLSMIRISDVRFSAAVPERLLPQLQESSTLVSIETIDGRQQLSGLVFVTNLLDIKTQGSIRKERHIREATQSAGQFFAVLNDLLRAGDDAALLTFLNFCDIPLVNAPRSPYLRNRPVWEGHDGMRNLGERNFQICKTLHDATLKFFERHLKKLKRHADSLALDGVSNFLQIFLSMGSLLRTQIERIVIALESQSSDVPPQKWSECRELWDVYFVKFRELTECLWDSYVKPLSSEYSRKEIQQEFGQDLDAINELFDAMILYRRRIEKVRLDKCVRRDWNGNKTPFPYFRSVLEPVSWKRYAGIVRGRQQHVELAVLGHLQQQSPPVHVQ